MHNYDLYVPTHLVFGRGRISELQNLVQGYGRKVLLTYGGGSVVRSGLLGEVKKILSDYEIFELSSISPNPKISSVRKGVEICKKEQIDFLVAIGGGSVIDATKCIAAGAYYDGDPWDLVLDNSLAKKALPLFDILTLTATGSEYDSGAVISNDETDEKLPFVTSFTFPIASIMDPAYTFTVPARQTAAGAADMFNHTLEQYIVMDGNILTDAMCEGMLKTIISFAPKALEKPDDYEARAQLMMAASFGCSGHLAIGRTPSPWVCHAIEHEISAYYDITHGVGLAIITPAWMRYSLNEKTAFRFAQYGVNVFGLDRNAPEMKNAKEAIRQTEAFFKSIGLPSKLSELGITDEHFDAMARHITKHWYPLTNAIAPVDEKGVVKILRDSL